MGLMLKATEGRSRSEIKSSLTSASFRQTDPYRAVQAKLIQNFRDQGVKGPVREIGRDFDSKQLNAWLKQADKNGIIVVTPAGQPLHIKREVISYGLPGGLKGGGKAFAVGHVGFTEHFHNPDILAGKLSNG